MPPYNSLVGLNWYNQNSQRAYPLADQATKKDTTSSFTLPDDLIVDLILPVSYAANQSPASFHLMEVGVFGSGVTIKIGYNNVEVCKVSISSTHVENSSYFMYGTGDFSDSIAKITIGSLDATMEYGGVFQFDLEGGVLVPTCIRPDVRGVSSLKFQNGTDLSDPYYGDIELLAGSNIKLSDESGKIRIDAISGENLNTDCGCAEDADRPLPDPIRTINGVVAPTVDGNIYVQSDRCITITNETNGLKLADVCSDPCCTSEELEKLLEDQRQLNKDIRLNYITLKELENRLLRMSDLASAISATGFIVPIDDQGSSS